MTEPATTGRPLSDYAVISEPFPLYVSDPHGIPLRGN